MLLRKDLLFNSYRFWIIQRIRNSFSETGAVEAEHQLSYFFQISSSLGFYRLTPYKNN